MSPSGSDTPTIDPPQSVVALARRLEEGGFETWCVGGALRDALMSADHLDWDLATAATPAQVRALFGNRRTVPVGTEFGTVGVHDSAGALIEVTTFRRDVRTDGRHAEVEFGVSLDDDLARRDFTINAMAFHPLRRELHDPLGGRDDLQAGLVRAVGSPLERMAEDRLRALRAIRFAARLRFEIEPETWAAVVASAPHLTRLSAERVRQEIEKTMEQVDEPSRAFVLWRDSGAFATLIPRLANVSDETLSAIDHTAPPSGAAPRARGRRLLRLAALLSDLDPGEVADVMTALRFSKQETSLVATIVGRWRTLSAELSRVLMGASPTEAQVRRWVSAMGRLNVPLVMRLAAARWLAAAASGAIVPSARAVHSVHRRLLRSAFRDAVQLSDLAIDGDDLRQAGIPAGPRLGKILHALLERVVEAPEHNERAWLLAEATRMERVMAGGGESAQGA